MTKFKVGEKVICIDGKRETGHGAGWELGKTIFIDHITNVSNNMIVYWPEKGGFGVFEDEIQHTNWKDRFEVKKE